MYNVIFCTLYFTRLPMCGKQNCRSKTDTEGQNLGHIVEKRIKNFGSARFTRRAALILNFKGVFMCNGKGSNYQPD